MKILLVISLFIPAVINSSFYYFPSYRKSAWPLSRSFDKSSTPIQFHSRKKITKSGSLMYQLAETSKMVKGHTIINYYFVPFNYRLVMKQMMNMVIIYLIIFSMMIKTYLDNFGHNRLTAYRDNSGRFGLSMEVHCQQN